MNSPKKVINHIVSWLIDYCNKSKMNGFVIGVSGGIDSAVVSTLCALTKRNVICLDMSIHQNKNEKKRSSDHINWLEKKFSNVKHYKISLSEVFDLFKNNPYLTDVILDKRLSRLNLIYLFSLMRKLKKLNIFKVYDLQNSSRSSFYKKILIYGFGIGLPLSMMGLYLNYYFDWNWKYLQFFGRSPNNIATPFIAFGYIGLIMLWIQKGSFRNLQADLKSIGKTALTAYLLQTVIATFIFYGIGLGLFGYVNRAYQLLIMFFIWFVLLKLCPRWLSKYHYGPVEWIWRMLTHMKLVKLLKQYN